MNSDLKIAVLVKYVPVLDDVHIDPATKQAVLSGNWAMNTFDGYGVSQAIDLREAYGGHVTAIVVGPASSREALMRALGTGADEAVHLVTDRDDLDTLDVASALAEMIRERDCNLVIAGQTADDYESGQTGIQVAELLGWPQVTLVTSVDLADDGSLLVRRDAEGAKELIGCPLPAVLTILSGRDGTQRFPNLRGMMAAKKKPFDQRSVDLESSKRLTWTAPVAIERHVEGVVLERLPADEAADQLVTWLKEHRLA